mgnify:CR=1 FL=1
MAESTGLIGFYGPGVDYDEIGPGGGTQISGQSDKCVIQTRYRLYKNPFDRVGADTSPRVNPPRFLDFYARLLGFPFVDIISGVLTLQRALPHPMLWWCRTPDLLDAPEDNDYQFWCTSVQMQCVAENGRVEDSYIPAVGPVPGPAADAYFKYAFGKYQWVDYAVTFESPLYKIYQIGSPSAPSAGPGYEHLRYTVVDEVPEHNIKLIDNHAYKIEWDPGSTPTRGTARTGASTTPLQYPVQTSWVTIRWVDVPDTFVASLLTKWETYRGFINQYAIFGYRAGTLLYVTHSKKPSRNVAGDIVWQVEFRFYKVDNDGKDHNWSLTNQLGFQKLRLWLGGTTYEDVFKPKDFRLLFQNSV